MLVSLLGLACAPRAWFHRKTIKSKHTKHDGGDSLHITEKVVLDVYVGNASRACNVA